jgi:hypothetical protein
MQANNSGMISKGSKGRGYCQFSNSGIWEHYSEQDIEQLIIFYKSPIGKKQ